MAAAARCAKQFLSAPFGPILLGVPTASLTFAADLQAVGDARRFLLSTLADWHVDEYDFAAPLVVTELATNAALHARTPYEVRLRLEPTHLLVEVVDGNPRQPLPRRYAVDASTGRGIALVDSLCRDWGVTPAAGGKVVWAQVRPDGAVLGEFDPDEFDDFVEIGDSSTSVTRSTGKRSTRGEDRARHADVAGRIEFGRCLHVA